MIRSVASPFAMILACCALAAGGLGVFVTVLTHSVTLPHKGLLGAVLLSDHRSLAATSVICSHRQCRALFAQPLAAKHVRLRSPFSARCDVLRARVASCPVPSWLHFGTASGYVFSSGGGGK